MENGGIITILIYICWSVLSLASYLCHGQVDIAIVGAGAAGTYSAWKLAQRYPEKSIHLYEYNNRIGGRLYSVPVPGIDDFVADLGAMRFYRERHTLLFDAIEELGLPVINFTTPKTTEKLYYLRGEYLLQEHVERGDVPYVLTDDERNFTSRLDSMMVLWNKQFIVPGEEDPLKRKTFDGRDVYMLGAYNEWQKYASVDAIRYAMDSTGIDHLIYRNQNLADVSETEYVDDATPKLQYLTLQDGMDMLAKKMVEEFLESNTTENKLYLNNELKQINSSTTDIALTFQDTQTKEITEVSAKQVVLALSQESIQLIDWPAKDESEELTSVFNSQINCPAVKIFLAYDYPWWRTEGEGWAFDKIRNSGEEVKFLVTDLPVRMVTDIGEDETTGKSLLLVYNVWHTNLQFWKYHIENGPSDPMAIEGEFTPSEELVNLTQTYLAKIFNLSTEDIPKPYATVTHVWYKAPYHTAWHSWSPGYKYPEVQEKVLKPLDERDIYVIGEAYAESHEQSWIEGAYDRAEAMLSQYFPEEETEIDKCKSSCYHAGTEMKFSHMQSMLLMP